MITSLLTCSIKSYHEKNFFRYKSWPPQEYHWICTMHFWYSKLEWNIFLVGGNVPKKKFFMITLGRASVWPRYTENLIFFCIGSTLILKWQNLGRSHSWNWDDLLQAGFALWPSQRLASVPAGLRFLAHRVDADLKSEHEGPQPKSHCPKQCCSHFWPMLLLGSHLCCLHQNVAHSFRVTLCKCRQSVPQIGSLNRTMGHCTSALTLGKQIMNWNHIW